SRRTTGVGPGSSGTSPSSPAEVDEEIAATATDGLNADPAAHASRRKYIAHATEGDLAAMTVGAFRPPEEQFEIHLRIGIDHDLLRGAASASADGLEKGAHRAFPRHVEVTDMCSVDDASDGTADVI